MKSFLGIAGVLLSIPLYAMSPCNLRNLAISEQTNPLLQKVNTYIRTDPSHQVKQVPRSSLYQYPFSANLKIRTFLQKGPNINCDGTIVEDRHLAVIPAHCLFMYDQTGHPILDSKTNKPILPMKIEAATGYENNVADQVLHPQVLIIGTLDPKHDLQDDFAIVYLKGPISQKVRPLPIDTRPLDGQDLQAMGHPSFIKNAEVLVHDPWCHFHPEFNGFAPGQDVAYHDCNLNEGASGAAIYEQKGSNFYYVGMHEGDNLDAANNEQFGVQYSEGTTNFAVKASHIYPALKRAEDLIRSQTQMASM